MTPRQIAESILCNVDDFDHDNRRDDSSTFDDSAERERRIRRADAVLEAMDDLRLKFATGPLNRSEDVARYSPPREAPKRHEIDALPDEELKSSSLRELLISPPEQGG